MQCKSCGNQLAEGSKFCPICGTPVSLQCPSCGAILAEGAEFCGACGAKINIASASAPQQQLNPPQVDATISYSPQTATNQQPNQSAYVPPSTANNQPTCHTNYSNTSSKADAKGFIAKIWAGDVPLCMTFWVYLIVGSAILDFLYRFIIGTSGALALVLAFIYPVYVIFMSIAVWRSAGKYKGANMWIVLARICVVLTILGLIYQEYIGYVAARTYYY